MGVKSISCFYMIHLTIIVSLFATARHSDIKLRQLFPKTSTSFFESLFSKIVSHCANRAWILVSRYSTLHRLVLKHILLEWNLLTKRPTLFCNSKLSIPFAILQSSVLKFTTKESKSLFKSLLTILNSIGSRTGLWVTWLETDSLISAQSLITAF